MGIHEGHRKRMREEFLARPDAFSDLRFLELTLGYALPRSDTNPLAHRLLERFGSLSGVLDATPDELRKLSGLGEYAVAFLKVMRECGHRYLHDKADLSDLVLSSEVAYRLVRPYFFSAREERVVLLCMDGKHKCLGIRQVGEGSVNSAEITTRKVVETALGLNATEVVLAHNHPSGLAIPSAEDLTTTRYLSGVLAAVGVRLADHLILDDTDMVSLRDSGYSLEPDKL